MSVMRMMKGASFLLSLPPHPSHCVLALLRVPTKSIDSGLAWKKVGPSQDRVPSTSMPHRVLVTRNNALPNPTGHPSKGVQETRPGLLRCPRY